ncbi:hypothetical protein [Mycobacterium malmoense]|uniref:Haemophore haem-binding domain-containing protein n=1 Tax=Mycobacterium malmoense TaxID=1780 RepID=A0ABX3SNI4_MYCMA|nr:hypothetical protein [Mycobacterium malmoense]OIN78119.1 hypothetical protein BMG05_24785 [Mycobacterium malmoense]ORA79599.1 hypothetical protein BST29_18615 [Mycobacterium malmoense]
MVSKILVGAAAAVGAAVTAAAPAGADPSVFGVLSCSCRETAPANSPALTENLNRGIQQGLSDPAVSR